MMGEERKKPTCYTVYERTSDPDSRGDPLGGRWDATKFSIVGFFRTRRKYEV